MELTPELKTKTGQAILNQRGMALRPVQAALHVLPVATGGHTAKELRPLRSSKNSMCGRWHSGFEPETAGEVRSRGVQKRSSVEVKELDAESDWSGLGGKKDRGWRQEVSFTLEEIRELLREQNGHLKRIAQGLDRLRSW